MSSGLLSCRNSFAFNLLRFNSVSQGLSLFPSILSFMSVDLSEGLCEDSHLMLHTMSFPNFQKVYHFIWSKIVHSLFSKGHKRASLKVDPANYLRGFINIKCFVCWGKTDQCAWMGVTGSLRQKWQFCCWRVGSSRGSIISELEKIKEKWCFKTSLWRNILASPRSPNAWHHRHHHFEL